MMMVLYVIGCSKFKLGGCHEARHLYTGSLFEMSKRYVEGMDNPYLIFSAEYGLIRPDKPIHSYERKMTARRAEQIVRSDMVRLPDGMEMPDVIVALCGKQYRYALILAFPDTPIDNWYTDKNGNSIGIGLIRRKLKNAIQEECKR